jgi:hypothetical protein
LNGEMAGSWWLMWRGSRRKTVSLMWCSVTRRHKRCAVPSLQPTKLAIP